jgi:hypothetical protein
LQKYGIVWRIARNRGCFFRILSPLPRIVFSNSITIALHLDAKPNKHSDIHKNHIYDFDSTHKIPDSNK